jgi:hypothetical protein
MPPTWLKMGRELEMRDNGWHYRYGVIWLVAAFTPTPHRTQIRCHQAILRLHEPTRRVLRGVQQQKQKERLHRPQSPSL